MRKYHDKEERAIRTERLVREWTRSGLIEKAQEDRILPELKVDLRRTNPVLRLILLGSGSFIIGSSVLLAGVTFKVGHQWEIATLCFFGAAASFVLAEYLIAAFRLYRFGIEEAAAVAGGTLLAVAAGNLASWQHTAGGSEFPTFVVLITGSIAGLAVYARFGYIYAAIVSMLCASVAPFETGLPPVTQRIASAGLLLLVFAVARLKHRKVGDEFPGDEYSIIQAIAWLGIYAFLNLQLSSFRSLFTPPAQTGSFYWFRASPSGSFRRSVYSSRSVGDRPLLHVSICLRA